MLLVCLIAGPSTEDKITAILGPAKHTNYPWVIAFAYFVPILFYILARLFHSPWNRFSMLLRPFRMVATDAERSVKDVYLGKTTSLPQSRNRNVPQISERIALDGWTTTLSCTNRHVEHWDFGDKQNEVTNSLSIQIGNSSSNVLQRKRKCFTFWTLNLSELIWRILDSLDTQINASVFVYVSICIRNLGTDHHQPTNYFGLFFY